MGLFGKLLGTDKISLLKAEITVLLLFFVLSIAGCGGGGYAIKKSTDDQFSDKSLPILVTLEENYIDFKAPLGIIPTSQLIPYLFRDNGGNIVETGFHLINVRMSGGMLHLQNQWLNIRTGDEIVFLVDEERISAIAHNTKIDHYTSNYNSVSRSIDTYYFDYAWYKFTKEQMARICYSKNIKIQVNGANGIEEYGTDKRGHSIYESFYDNNKNFFYEEIMGKK